MVWSFQSILVVPFSKHYHSRHHSTDETSIQLNLKSGFWMHFREFDCCAAYLFGTSCGSKTRFFDYLCVAYHMLFNRCACCFSPLRPTSAIQIFAWWSAIFRVTFCGFCMNHTRCMRFHLCISLVWIPYFSLLNVIFLHLQSWKEKMVMWNP